MKKIVYIKNTKTDGVVHLGVYDSDSEETIRLTVSHTQSPHTRMICVGDELSDVEYEEVALSDEEYRARKYALSLLALADNNEKTLKRKLVSRGIGRDVAERVCEQMVSLGYINEERQLERLILSDANSKFYGPSKIIMRLAAKGYSASDVRTVMHRLVDSGEIDFTERARALIEKTYPDGASAEDKKKTLYKHGYKIC